MFLRQTVLQLLFILGCLLLQFGNEVLSNPIISNSDNEAMAGLMLSKGKNKEALQYMSKAIAKNPGNAMLYSNRSTCYMRLKELKKALADINKAFDLKKKQSLSPAKDAMLYFNRGSIYLEMKQEKEAFRDIKRSTEIWPLNGGAQLRLAEMYEKQGKKTLAIKTYNGARQLYRDFGGPKAAVDDIDERIKRLGGKVIVVEQPKTFDDKPKD
jgi:tetratricopeptide (TPR) repeat protein